MPSRGKVQCFEEYMSAETLVIGEIYSPQPESISLWVLNPKDNTILEKVILYSHIELRRKQDRQIYLHNTRSWILQHLS